MFMKSLQFIVPKQIIKYTKATRNKNVLTIKGEELLKVTEVLLNNYTCDVWVKISDNTLLIEIPEFLHAQSITSIALFGKASNLSTATLSAEFNDKPVDGLQKLVQRYVKYLLQAPNSNAFTPGGGGLLSFIGTNTTEDGKNINSRVIDAISATNTLLFDEQAKQQLPLSEKLLGASVLGITAAEPDEVVVSIKITNQAGVTATAAVNL
jgi:hypothetical protein